MEKIDFENYSAAQDIPDNRDYTSEEVYGEVGSSIELPKKFSLDKSENWNQGNIGACTVFGSTNAFNEKYAHSLPDNVKYEHPFNPWHVWEKAKILGASDKSGWIFQSALQLLKNMNHIGGYVNLNTSGFANVQKIKEAMYLRKSAVVTGLPNVNWSETMKRKEFVKGSYYGQGAHIFDLSKWDDEYVSPYTNKVGCFISDNSWGSGGWFRIMYDDIKEFYSQYEFVLTESQQKFIEAKKKRKNKYLEVAAEKKIWNEERGEDKCTPTELRIMLNRVLALTDNKIHADWKTFRSSYAYLFDFHMVRGKFKIYNEEKKFSIATDDEIAIMFQRAVKGNPNENEFNLIREEVVTILIRDFFLK